MADPELIRQTREAMERHRRKVPPGQRFAWMVARKIINEKGEVLMTEAEKKAGRPLEDEPPNGASASDSPGPPNATEN